ncbi:MAG: hypothetical protein MI810_02640 [Flavobacteriales bacterium]|jgi:hypothetical protein|nr:hypothetical protein [Flavobacteriales bacterium]
MKSPKLFTKIAAVSFTAVTMTTFVAYKAGAFKNFEHQYLGQNGTNPPDTLKKDSIQTDSLKKDVDLFIHSSKYISFESSNANEKEDTIEPTFMHTSKSFGGVFEDHPFTDTSYQLGRNPGVSNHEGSKTNGAPTFMGSSKSLRMHREEIKDTLILRDDQIKLRQESQQMKSDTLKKKTN